MASLSRKTGDEHTPKQQPTPKSCLLESGGDVTPGSGEYPTTKDEMQFQLSLQVKASNNLLRNEGHTFVKQL